MFAKFFRLSWRVIISIWLFSNVEARAMVSSMRLGSMRVFYSNGLARSLFRMESNVILFKVEFLL